MLRNYLKTTLRNFHRHLGYTVINLSGLTIGLTTSIFIFLWILDEFSYDAHHRDHERIYAVIEDEHFSDGKIESGQSTTAALADALVHDIPEVEVAARSDWGNDRILRHEAKSFIQRGVWADRDLFRIMTYPLAEGDARNPMPDNNSIVITRSVADKFFPGEKALGKSFRVDEKYDMRVTAVIEDPPFNSQLRFDFLTPYDVHAAENQWLLVWDNYNDKTYVKLRAGASPEEVNKKLKPYFKQKCADCTASVWLQPYSDVRLYNRYSEGKIAGGRIDYIRIFAIIAVFILIIACINFMNLATARSATRSREVGVRKVIGAQRQSLIVQFIGESVLLSFAALLLALALVQVMLPFFNLVTEKQVSLDFGNLSFSISLLLVTLLTGVIAGSYPAFFLSSFRPAMVLKGNIQSLAAGASLRKILVVFQVTLSIVLIIASVVVMQQVSYIHEANLGFNRDNIVAFDMHDSTFRNKDGFKNEILRQAGVKSITFAGQDPFNIGWTSTGVTWPGKEEGRNIPFKMLPTDKDFIPTLGMTLLEGRNFDNEAADSVSYIVNETALETMGIKNPINTPLTIWGHTGRIIGVLRNFNNTHLSQAIEPLILMCQPGSTWRAFVKIDGRNTTATLRDLEQVQKAFDPNYPINITFLDDAYQRQYKMEGTVKKVSLYFTIVAVFISCLGLFGLASFTAERRTKELGIRKILGASAANLVTLLCTDFTRLVVIAAVLACPLGYYLMDRLLSTYVFHAPLGWNVFILSSAAMLVIAVFTVLFQSLKAALNNPVHALRRE